MTSPISDRPGPYASAFDLPKFVELSNQLQAFKLLTLVLAPDKRAEVQRLERQLRDMGETVDRFYALLGPQHWVFHDQLSLDGVAELLTLTPAEAEQGLIDIYRGAGLDHWVRWLRRHPGLQAREQQLRQALDDYRAGRYYSTVHVLIAVMDGFVNDLDPATRKGLAAREAGDMVAWDSLVGHHMGLTNVMGIFQRTCKARNDEPVYELHRHGIVHGTLTNYNNVVVATKAWNYLFAVADWATARKKQAEPAKEPPTWRGIVTQVGETKALRDAIAAWQPSTLTPVDASWADNSLVEAAEGFLHAWRNGNYGQMAQTLQAKAATRHKGPAGAMRDRFDCFTLESFTMTSIAFTAASIGVVHADLRVSGRDYISESRWIFENEKGEPRVHGRQDGQWARVFEGPEGFIKGWEHHTHPSHLGQS